MTESDERVRQTVDAFLKGTDGKPSPQLRDAAWDEVARVLKEDGRLLDLNFMNRLVRHHPADARPEFIEIIRNAFFTGAQCVLALMQVTDGHDAPTPEDSQRFENIVAEVDAFKRELASRYAVNLPTAGNA